LLVNRKLTGDGSAKEVRHFEIALPETELTYEAGDALGIIPSNDPALVSDLLATMGFDGEEAVPGAEGSELPLRLALGQQYDITKPSTDLLKAIAERNPGCDLAVLLDPARREDLKKYLWGREVIDLVSGLANGFVPADFVKLLKKLQPRLYSISSSPKAHPGEVHLTVGAVRYESHGRKRGGVCSTFLADRASADTALPVFVQASHGFKLPGDLTRPVIMVGPGTGIAPFRAFLEERAATGSTGKNWLFFGDQRRSTDYLYQETLESWHQGAHLHRLDLAFSRDQENKVYVQHRMLEAAAELWAWLTEGAHFYVCGDASRMAKDVDVALHQVCETAGGLSADAAKEYVSKLKSEKRYQRDVY
jgi:sulfite reductase (NADPH) flavoprotein alpha-component